MIKRAALALVLVSFIFLAGCETTKGVGCVAEGAGKDAVGFWGAIQKADLWIRQNLW